MDAWKVKGRRPTDAPNYESGNPGRRPPRSLSSAHARADREPLRPIRCHLTRQYLGADPKHAQKG